MKTLHITNSWRPSSGGIGTFYRALMAAASERGFAMRLVAPWHKTEIDDSLPHVRVYHVAAPRTPFRGGYRWLLPQQYLLPGGAVRRIIDAERPTLVEINDKYTLPYLAGLLRRGWLIRGYRPTVTGLSCERMDENLALYLPHFPLPGPFSRVYMKWLYFPMFDHHLTVSGHTAGELRDAARGHDVQRAVWIRPMGVDLSRFHPSRREEQLRRRLLSLSGGGERGLLLLYAGRLAREKNLDLLCGVMRLLIRDPAHDFRMLVAGDGPERERFEAGMRRAAPGRAVFLGHVAGRDELAGLYASSDAFLHPNPNEPFGIAPLEAMASGLPLVAPASGGVLSYATQENAWLTEPAPQAFADAVCSLANHPESRLARVEAARRTALIYDWPTVAGSFLDLYAAIDRWRRGLLSHPTPRPDFLSTGHRWGLDTPTL